MEQTKGAGGKDTGKAVWEVGGFPCVPLAQDVTSDPGLFLLTSPPDRGRRLNIGIPTLSHTQVPRPVLPA